MPTRERKKRHVTPPPLRAPDGEREDARWAPRIKWRTTVPLLVLLAFAIHAFLPRVANLRETFALFRQLRWWAVALAVLAQAASNAWGGFLIQRTALLTGDRLGIWRATRLGLAASSVGLLVGGPLGFAAAAYAWMRRDGVSREGATIVGWLPALLNASTLALFACIGLVSLVFVRNVAAPPVAVLVLAVVIGVLGFALFAAFRAPQRVLGWIAKMRAWWARLRHKSVDQHALTVDRERLDVARQAFHRGGWKGPLAGALLNTVFDLTSLYLLFLAAHWPIGFETLLAGYGLPEVAGRLSFLPGGLGVIEGGMVGLYDALGVPSATAVLVVLAYRGLSFWLPTLVGFPLAVLETRRGVERRR